MVHSFLPVQVWLLREVAPKFDLTCFFDLAGANSSCPKTGIKYLPKTGSGPLPPSTTTSVGASPTAIPGTPFSGRGTLVVISDGKQNGCIISGGTWYTTGTCATFTATTTGS